MSLVERFPTAAFLILVLAGAIAIGIIEAL